MNGRTALGVCLVLLAVLAGAIFLDRAQRLLPVYAAARDLPAGLPLKSGDLMVVRVRLPAAALRHYLRPGHGTVVSGRVLAAPVRRETLVPAELVLASSRHADLVELPVQVDPGDMAQGLRPGDSVQLLAAYTEGARRGRAVILLPSAEVVQVLQDPTGLTATGRDRGVQLRMPSERAPVVAAAIATARIFVVKAPGPAADPAPSDPAPSDPTPSSDLPEPPPDTSESPAAESPAAEPDAGAQDDTTTPSTYAEPSEPQPAPPPPGTDPGRAAAQQHAPQADRSPLADPRVEWVALNGWAVGRLSTAVTT